MSMAPRLRKFILTIHIASSVGWLGAVACFLALALMGLTSRDALMVRSAYLAMNLITWFIIVPLSFASPLTGLVLALGTRWGLFRHYWVLIKLLLTVFSTIVLLIHIQPINLLASVAAQTTVSAVGVGKAQEQLVIAPIAALLVFLVTTTLAVYKPKGRTGYGERKQLISN